jgi:polar amino acid transport system substrate-binding protein
MRGVSSTRVRRAIACSLLAICAIVLAGCATAPTTKLEPKIAPPAIKQAGTLKVGVDLAYPPFGGTDAGKQAGIDLDVAAALAAKLGLTAAIVDVKPSAAATALADGKVDVVFSVPYDQESLSRSTLAGSYLSDGPAFFIATESTAAVVPSMTLDSLPAVKIGAQEGSAAFWKLQSEFGPESLVGYPTLRDALNGLREGKVRIAAGDALVGGYIIRDMPTVHFAGQVEPAIPLGVAVALDNVTLGDAVRSGLDGLSADGVLDAIRTKWVGSLPKLRLPESMEESSSLEASVGP